MSDAARIGMRRIMNEAAGWARLAAVLIVMEKFEAAAAAS